MSMATPSWWSFDLHRPLFPGNARGVEHAAFLALALVRPRPEAGPNPRPQLGGFQMMTFFEGSSPGALAMLP